MNADYLVGKVIKGRYEVLEVIGTGGMATVYKARDRALSRFVAIKALKDSLKFDSEIVKRFNGESKAAARLSHPNIVQVYDVGEGEELDYIVMECVEGITLKEYITKNGKLSWEIACDFAAQIGRALECAHANHIIHRDIKPHNVMITRDGTLKVTDFGIAQASTSETMIAGSSGIGSVHYISPEQARGRFTDERSDIYSLGVVLYEMLTGEVPFDGANPVSIALMKLEQEPVDCRTINPSIHSSAAEIAMKAISKEKHARYQSASEMVRDLEGVIGGAGHEHSEDDERYTTRRIPGVKKPPKKKNPHVMQLGAIAIAAACVIGFATFLLMSGGTKEYMVPELLGLTIEEAEEKLAEDKEADLTIDQDITMEASEEVEEGQIISQKPGANQYVKKGRKIKVVVSSGNEEAEIPVPDVENLPYEDAVKKLEKAGLKVKRIEEFSETIQFEYVIKQTPKSETKVMEGYTVSLHVSADIENPNKPEDEQIVVPKVTGIEEEKAIQMITESGLKVTSIERQPSEKAEGTVIQQNPSAKTGVEKGSGISIVVSSGPQATPSPTPTPTAAPTATPTPTPTPSKSPEMKKKTITIAIPDDAADKVSVRAVANGKTIYEKTHNKSEGTVDIPVQSDKDVNVQVFIDGALLAEKVVSFN